MGEIVKYSCDGSIATITLDDGKVNALSLAMQAAINRALDSAEQDGAIIVLQGRPGKFSAGFDMATLTGGGQQAADMLMGGFDIAKRLLAYPRPVVVACSGHALAMGLFLVLCGDYCIGIDGKYKLCANEVAIGLTLPRTAIEICRNRLAPAHFFRATLTSEAYTPATAIAAGMLDEITTEGELLPRAMQKAQEFEALNAAAYAGSKEIIHGDLLAAMETAMTEDRKTFMSMFGLA
ncbi:MAG: crotonase/enoyl-CoA hydratase family protein [Pseudomonadales bacterium]